MKKIKIIQEIPEKLAIIPGEVTILRKHQKTYNSITKVTKTLENLQFYQKSYQNNKNCLCCLTNQVKLHYRTEIEQTQQY